MNDKNQLSIAFCGGGCRTFWGLGAYDRIEGMLPPVREWSGVSAGAAMGTACALGRARETLEVFRELTDANRRNAYLLNIFNKERVFPHEPMYRAAIDTALVDGGFERLGQVSPVRYLLAHVIPGVSRFRAITGGIRAYRRRKKRHVVHGPEEPPRGLALEIATAQDAAGPSEIADMIIRSSVTPPMTGVPVEDGRTYVDGSLIENVPVRALSNEARRGKVLVLHTRAIPPELLPNSESRLYLVPSETVPISMWDYTSPDKVLATFEQGRQDAENSLGQLEDFLRS